MSKNYPGDNSRDKQMEAIAQQLPDGHRILDAAWAALIELDAALLAGDAEKRTIAVLRFEACIWKLNGNTFFGCGASKHDAEHVVNDYCKAEDGEIPLWGQNGQFLVQSTGGLRARVKIRAGCMIGYLSASFNAVDLGAPFISETGYRSYMFEFAEVKPGETVYAHMTRIFQQFVDARKKPLYIANDSRDSLAAEEVPAWMKSITPPPDRMPETLPEGFERVQVLLPASKAFMARKWATAAQDRITEILRSERDERLHEMEQERERRRQMAQDRPKIYKDALKKVQHYREFYVGARCKIVKVHHPVHTKIIGTIIKIVTIYDTGNVEAYEDKPVRHRINRRGVQVVEFDPTCVRSFYSVDQLQLLDDNENNSGES
ncbi:TPA: protein klcB [Salmonella enterica subsp. enterica serovar 16:l,v:-]